MKSFCSTSSIKISTSFYFFKLAWWLFTWETLFAVRLFKRLQDWKLKLEFASFLVGNIYVQYLQSLVIRHF